MNDTRAVIAGFRLHGLSLQPAALQPINQYIKHHRTHNTSITKQEITTLLNDVIAQVKIIIAQDTERAQQASIVDHDTIQQAIQHITQPATNNSSHTSTDSLSSPDTSSIDRVLQIQALACPRWNYDPHSQRFQLTNTSRPSILPTADSRIALFRNRFETTLQRVRTQPAFSRLATIDGLCGARGKHCVFGMLAVLSDGALHLEDRTGSIRLHLKDNAHHGTAGFFAENSFVIVEGKVHPDDDSLFVADQITMPPIESRVDSLTRYTELDVCRELKLADSLGGSPDDYFLLLSDCWMDESACVNRLQSIFSVFNDNPVRPAMIVLMGSFSSPHQGTNEQRQSRARQLTSLMNSLANMLSEFAHLCADSHFVILPSLSESSFGVTMPLMPLLQPHRKQLEAVCHRGVTFGSNPHRVNWHGRECVFYRDDIQLALSQSALVPPAPDIPTAEHCIATLAAQGNLAPVPSSVRSVYAELDSAMSLFPLPHFLCLSQRLAAAEMKFGEMCTVNTGSLAKSGEFIVYFPQENRAEHSRVP